MAQVRAARGDHDAATRLLDEAAALYRPGFYPDVRPIAAMRARVQISAGDLDAAAALGRGSEVSASTTTRTTCTSTSTSPWRGCSWPSIAPSGV